MRRKLLSIVIAALMALSLLPMGALANGTTGETRADSAMKSSLFWSFEVDPEEDGWEFVDNDGDGKNWEWSTDYSESTTHSIRSVSYDYGVLNPDNIAITPLVTVDEDNAKLTYYCRQSGYNCKDVYAIYAGETKDITEMEKLTEDLSQDQTSSFVEHTVDLSAVAGKTVYIAIRHYNCSDQYRIYFDDVTVTGTLAGETPVDPTDVPVDPTDEPDPSDEPADSIIWDFESDPWAQGFTKRDADGDGHEWTWVSNATSYQYHHEGNGCMQSDSYVTGSVLYPDNWLITPQFAGGGTMTFWYNPRSSSFPEDNVSVYVSEDGGESWSDSLCDVETPSSVNPVEYTVDLSAFAGKTIVAAFRHYNCSDQYSAMLDYITVTAPQSAEPTETPAPTETPDPTEEPAVIDTVNVNGMEELYAGENSADHLNATVDEGAHYSVVSVSWRSAGAEFTGSFVSGNTYSKTFVLAPEDGYVFASAFTATIDGSQDNVLYKKLDNGNAVIYSKGIVCQDAPVDPTEPPEPTDEPEAPVYGCYFETQEEIADWSAWDRDGDGDNWDWYCGANVASYAYEGEGFMGSYSFGENGEPLTPDNWLVSPQIELGEGAPYVTLYAAYLSWSGEVFGVFAGTDTDNMEQVGENVTPSADYQQYRFDLSKFAGQKVYIAIRHYNCSDAMTLRIDQFEVWDSPAEESNVIDKIEVEGFVAPKYGEAPFYGVTVSEGAKYELVDTTWYWVDANDPETGDWGEVGEGEVFNDANKLYYQEFSFLPLEGYEFAEGITMTINGGSEYVGDLIFDLAGETWVGWTIDFTVEEPSDILWGDADGNGEVNEDDALLVMRYAQHIAEIAEENMAVSDVNGDGKINLQDALLILRKVQKLIDAFPVEE